MSDILCAHVIFSGLVQGVFFRRYTKEKADELALSGMVRNLPDGSVEMMAQGPRHQIEALIEYLQGPQGPGRIDSTTVSFSPGNNRLEQSDTFSIL